MGGGAVKVAGLGFRTAASAASLQDALNRTGTTVDALATATDKADAAPIRELAHSLGLPLIAVEVAGVPTPTQSPRVMARFGTGSLAEAAALAAAGPGAQIIVRRVTSHDGMATAAIAWKGAE